MAHMYMCICDADGLRVIVTGREALGEGTHAKAALMNPNDDQPRNPTAKK